MAPVLVGTVGLTAAADGAAVTQALVGQPLVITFDMSGATYLYMVGGAVHDAPHGSIAVTDVGDAYQDAVTDTLWHFRPTFTPDRPGIYNINYVVSDGSISTTVARPVKAVYPARTTAEDWVLKTERMLTAGAREERNKLTNAVADTTAGLITVTFPLGRIQPGAWISVDLEDMYVWSVSGQTATVERGMYGSNPATHVAGSIVQVRPKHSKFMVLEAINDDLAALASAGLYDMAQVELTFNPQTAGYDLPGVTGIEDIYKIEAKYTGLTGDWRPVRSWSFDREANTTDFASGFTLRLNDGGESGQKVRVHYKQGFVTLPALTSDVATTLLPVSAYDIPSIGAAARLTGPREVGRNDTSSQGDTRRAEEVPARMIAASAGDLWKLWDRRVGQELNELQRRYPTMLGLGS